MGEAFELKALYKADMAASTIRRQYDKEIPGPELNYHMVKILSDHAGACSATASVICVFRKSIETSLMSSMYPARSLGHP